MSDIDVGADADVDFEEAIGCIFDGTIWIADDEDGVKYEECRVGEKVGVLVETRSSLF